MLTIYIYLASYQQINPPTQGTMPISGSSNDMIMKNTKDPKGRERERETDGLNTAKIHTHMYV